MASLVQPEAQEMVQVQDVLKSLNLNRASLSLSLSLAIIDSRVSRVERRVHEGGGIDIGRGIHQ